MMLRSILCNGVRLSNHQLRSRYHSMSKTGKDRKLLLSVKANPLENVNRTVLTLPEKEALMWLCTGTALVLMGVYKWGPNQTWYFDKWISLKLKIYNTFAEEKIEVVEDFKFEELKLDERPRKKPYVKVRDRIEVEEY